MHGITIHVVDRGAPVPNAKVTVGGFAVHTNEQGLAQCAAPDDVQLVHVKHGAQEVKRWVLPDTDESVVIDLSLRAPAESLVESLVGDRYRFLEVLGRGGMGVVIKAHDALLNRVVAIKMLAGDLESNEEAQRIFLEEARSLAPLSHPNLVSIHDIQHLQGHTLMVLEFVVGQNLDRRLVAGPLPVEQVLRYVIQMARATNFMHGRGFIHRDLKPGNVIVGDDDQVKIIDFGLARSLDIISAKGTQIRGTPAYMAPEQIRGLDLTQKVDTYQLGVTIFELLTGQLPFRGDMGYAHVHSDAPSLTSVLPQVNPELAALVSACMAKDPAARPTAKDLLDELQMLYVATAEMSDAMHDAERLGGGDRISDWRRTTGGGLRAVEEVAQTEPPPSRIYMFVLVTLMLMFGGLAGYFAMRAEPPQPAEPPVAVAAPIVEQPVADTQPEIQAPPEVEVAAVQEPVEPVVEIMEPVVAPAAKTQPVVRKPALRKDPAPAARVEPRPNPPGVDLDRTSDPDHASLR